MKKILTVLLLTFGLQTFAQSNGCNTAMSFTGTKKQLRAAEWCIKVTANKLDNGLYPYFAEFSYKAKSGNDTAIFVRAGFIGSGTMLCKAYFTNMESGSLLNVRTINFTFNRLWGSPDPTSEHYNPYYGKTDAQIYAEIKNDPSKWCHGNTVAP